MQRFSILSHQIKNDRNNSYDSENIMEGALQPPTLY